MGSLHAVITGIHGYVPDHVLTNHDLEKMVNTSDEWIIARTGIKERRILKGQSTSVIAVKAIEALLEKTSTKVEEIDLIICATTTPDFIFPATANIISEKIGAINCFGYDIQAACSGFLYALATGSQFIATGKYKKIIVVGADKMSSIIDYSDRNTCIIFGDGGAAVLLEPTRMEYGIQDFILRSEGSGAPYLNMQAGGSVNPTTIETVKNKAHYARQDGSKVFKFAIKNMVNIATEIMRKNHLNSKDITYLVPHQANKRIIDAVAQRIGVSDERTMVNIHKYGNTASATIPLCLFDYEHKLRKGDNLILVAFGGGFTWGSLWLKWAYDPIH